MGSKDLMLVLHRSASCTTCDRSAHLERGPSFAGARPRQAVIGRRTFRRAVAAGCRVGRRSGQA
jgi:hypothetical protein